MRFPKFNSLFFEKIAFYLFIFFLPSQLGYHFWPSYSFIFGIRVDYLSPTIYFTDLLAIIFLTFFLIRQKENLLKIVKKSITPLVIIGTLSLSNILISISPLVTLFKWLKLLEVFLITSYISQNFQFLKTKTFVKILSLSLMMISIIGISQFLLGRTLGGIFYLLGERNFNISTPGIALQSLWGIDYLRSYSIFSHPNSFAGYMLFISSILIYLKEKFKLSITEKRIVFSSLILSFAAFCLTFSVSAFLGLALFIVLFFLSKKEKIFIVFFKYIVISFLVLSFAMPFISPKRFAQTPQIQERLSLAKVAGTLIVERPILGYGLTTFVINLPKVQNDNSYFWFFQPVHNIFLLILSEVGILGLCLFTHLLYKLQKIILTKKSYLLGSILVVVLFISLFDHYFLTLQQNLLSLSLLFGAAFTLKKA